MQQKIHVCTVWLGKPQLGALIFHTVQRLGPWGSGLAWPPRAGPSPEKPRPGPKRAPKPSQAWLVRFWLGPSSGLAPAIGKKTPCPIQPGPGKETPTAEDLQSPAAPTGSPTSCPSPSLNLGTKTQSYSCQIFEQCHGPLARPCFVNAPWPP